VVFPPGEHTPGEMVLPPDGLCALRAPPPIFSRDLFLFGGIKPLPGVVGPINVDLCPHPRCKLPFPTLLILGKILPQTPSLLVKHRGSHNPKRGCNHPAFKFPPWGNPPFFLGGGIYTHLENEV